ncbi:histamine H3 receptor-like [Protopterus annectens]|uniref:histamine H3 receptor-like n=1 Tax=Protopterus annectens TaxID=7888 RepID=UPI001CFB714E|nr:histamine H3 receptor-like [Protopterus annectens]
MSMGTMILYFNISTESANTFFSPENGTDVLNHIIDPLPRFTGTAFVILIVSLAAMVLITIVGNGFVFLVFIVDKRLRTHSNFFLLNLAVCDFFVGAFSVPVYTPYLLTGRWPFGRVFCKLWLVIDSLLCVASVFNIVLISYDRFLSVTKAVAYRAQQQFLTQSFVKMIAVWVLSFFCYGPAIILWDYITGISIVPPWECFFEYHTSWNFLIGDSACTFLVPFCSVTYFNICIYWNIRNRRNQCIADITSKDKHRELPSKDGNKKSYSILAALKKKFLSNQVHSPSLAGPKTTKCSYFQILLYMCCKKIKTDAASIHFSHSMDNADIKSQSISPDTRLSRDKKIAKSLAVLVCVFTICWAPYKLLMLFRSVFKGQFVNDYWYELSFWLLWLNSTINPFLYPLCHSSFKRAFVKLFSLRQ